MKKYLSIILLISLVACKENKPEAASTNDNTKVILVVHPEDSKKEHYSLEQIEYIKKIGMNNSLTVKENYSLTDKKLEDFYFKKFNGVRFISDSTLNFGLTKKRLIVGDLNLFTGKIPSSNIEELKKNYETIKSIDKSIEGFYFIRVSRLAANKDRRGQILQKIDTSDLLTTRLDLIHGGTDFRPHGQDDLTVNESPLKQERLKFFAKKYNVPLEEMVVDCKLNSSGMKIMADLTMFNMSGQEVVNNEIRAVKPKDPAILLKVDGGWLILTTWQ